MGGLIGVRAPRAQANRCLDCSPSPIGASQAQLAGFSSSAVIAFSTEHLGASSSGQVAECLASNTKLEFAGSRGRVAMNLLRIAAALVVTFGCHSLAQEVPQPTLKLWWLDCGRLDENRDRPWAWQKVPTPTSCYLVAQGSRYLLWDAGMSARALGNQHPTYKLERTIPDQLAVIGVNPEQVEFVRISHYHGDHTGQARQLPKATLLIGAG
jgi:hypothetical protein